MIRRAPRAPQGGRRFSLLALTIGLCSCAGPQFHHQVVDTGDVRYRMPPPAAPFERVHISDYDVAYSDPRLGTMGVHATCREYTDVPPKALLNQLLFGTTERTQLLLETVTLDGRGALHARYAVSLDGVPVVLELFVVSKDGCLFDFSLVTAPEAGPAGRQAFERWVGGFSMLGRRPS